MGYGQCSDETAIKFHAPSWNREKTDLNEAHIQEMMDYFRTAASFGLPDDAIAEDLQGKWGHLGRISIKPRGTELVLDPTVWILVEDIARC